MDQQIPVRVAIRCRPLIKKERNEGCEASVQADPESKTIQMRGDSRVYTFDWTFAPSAPQFEIYEACVQGRLDSVFKGYNLTVLAYGQTGSGKTHTMGTEPSMMQFDDRDSWGLIPRYVADLFEGVKERQELFLVKVTTSFIEIYNEKVYDLLAPDVGRDRRELLIRENNEGIVLPDLVKTRVNSLEDVMKLLEKGSSVRSKGATAMNESSSRSHAVFSLYLSITSRSDDANVVCAKCHLVDLAGSERLDKTMATGDRKKEGININLGLFHLGRVIEALTPAEGKSDRNRLQHVPYRNHNLTRLLQDSLGGNSHTIFLACVSPADSNFDETVNTLKYAEKASRIKNKPVVNRDPVTAELMRLRQENAELRQRLQEAPASRVPGFVAAEIPQNNDDIKMYRERVEQLEAEVSKLSDQLVQAAAKRAVVFEEVIVAEGRYDRLKEKLEEFCQETEKSIETLTSTHFDPEEKRNQLSQFRRVFSDLRQILTTETVEEQTTASDEETEEQMETDGVEEEKKHLERQRQQEAEMERLIKMIREKEKVANVAKLNDVQIEQLKQQHEKELRDLEAKILSLEQQKEHAQSSTAKVGELRRKRLMEVEAELKEARKQLKEAQKAQKLKAQNAREIQKLHEEIKAMKVSKVKLMKQMKEECEKFRKFKQRNEVELNQLKQKDKKREFELVKVRREYEKQMAVSKQKSEEATALLRRLQNQQLLQRQAAQSKLVDAVDNDKMVASLKAFLNRELDLIVGAEEARLQRVDLIQQRKLLVQDINRLNKKIDKMNTSLNAQGEPNAKRRKSEVDTEELQQCQSQVATLTTELNRLNEQIVALQKESCEGESEEKETTRFSKILSLPQARCALKLLFSMALEAKVEWTKAGRETGQLRGDILDLKEMIANLESSAAETKAQWADERRHLEEKLTEVERATGTKMALLLDQIQIGKVDVPFLSAMQKEQAEKFEMLSAKWEETLEEQKAMKMELSKASVQGRRATKLFPTLRRSASHSSTRTTTSSDNDETMAEPLPVRRTRSDRLSKPVSRYGSSASLKKVAEVTGDSDESESDVTEGDNDSSFHETPAGKQVKKLAHELKKKRKLAAAAPGPNVTFDVPPEDDEEEEEEPKKREFLAPLNPPPTSNTVVAQKPVGMSPSADLSVAGLMAMTTTPKHHGKFFAPLKGVQGKH